MKADSPYFEDMLAARPHNGGYEIAREDGGSLYASESGMQQFACLDRIWMHWRDELEAWVEHNADRLCEHGARLDSEDFGWHVNDYCFEGDFAKEPENWTAEVAVFIFYAFADHDCPTCPHRSDLTGEYYSGHFCMPAWFDAKQRRFYWDGNGPNWWPEAVLA